MENKQMKCIKGQSCLYCGSNYCQFVDELDQLKAENDLYKNAYKTEQDRRRAYENALAEIKEIAEREYYETTY